MSKNGLLYYHYNDNDDNVLHYTNLCCQAFAITASLCAAFPACLSSIHEYISYIGSIFRVNVLHYMQNTCENLIRVCIKRSFTYSV